MKNKEPLICGSCERKPAICQWTDTVNPNATWIECECGMMTDTVYHEDPDMAKDLAIDIWNGSRAEAMFCDTTL